MSASRQPEQKDPYLIDEQLMPTETIGKGSFGVVYRDTYQEQAVAIKFISKHEKEAFKQENAIMQTFKTLQIPYVVNYIGYQEIYNYFLIVMDYMNLGSLADLIDNKDNPNKINISQVDRPTRITYMQHAGTAMQYLHDYGFMHHDIKPGNILLKGENLQSASAYLADFDHTKQMSSNTSCDCCFGTTDYMAPEVWRHMAHNAKADIYSFSATLLEVGQESPPFDYNEMRSQICRKVTKGERPAIPETFPKSYAKLITWGWAQKPHERPSAEEMLKGLEEVQKELRENLLKKG